jgi:hypothetical protein
MACLAFVAARRFPRGIALLALLFGPARLFAQLPLTPTVEWVEHAAVRAVVAEEAVPVAASAPEDEARDLKPGYLLRLARSVAVCSRDSHIPVDTLIGELLAARGFRDFDLNIVRDSRAADLVIQIDHPLHLFDFTYIVTDRRTNIVLASGKVIAWDGIRAAPPLAKKIVAGLKETQQTYIPPLRRRPEPSTAPPQEE